MTPTSSAQAAGRRERPSEQPSGGGRCAGDARDERRWPTAEAARAQVTDGGSGTGSVGRRRSDGEGSHRCVLSSLFLPSCSIRMGAGEPDRSVSYGMA
uniref:Uncharacterized protein n=1 Tax=Oryza glumipatula TaxID=40148 RepID=A0A0E0BL85_9ORYZ